MADRKLTVLNPAGYMEILQSSDNLVLDGSLQMTGTITDLPNCVNDNDAARKKYVDDSVAAIVSGAPSALAYYTSVLSTHHVHTYMDTHTCTHACMHACMHAYNIHI